MHRLRPPQIELKQLYYFLTLSRHKSISAAAQELGIAQPSLSSCVSNLESRLDVDLVIRGSSGVRLTEAGDALARYAAEVIERTDAAVERICELGTKVRGAVSLGVPPSLSAILSVPLIETVQNQHPAVQLTIVEAMDGTTLNWLRSDELDLGCVYAQPDTQEFSVWTLFQEDIFLATAPDNWPHKIGPSGFATHSIKATTLQELPLAMPRVTHGSRRMIEKAVRKHGIRLNVVTEIDSLPQMLELVERASCYSLVPQKAVLSQMAAATIALVPIVSPKIRQTTFVVRKSSHPTTRAITVVEEAIVTVLKDVIRRRKLDIDLI